LADGIKGIAGAIPAIGIGMDIANAVGGWFGGNERYFGKRDSLTTSPKYVFT